MKCRRFVFALPLLLSACADWPDLGAPPLSRQDSDWPRLLPLETVLQSGQVSDAAPDAEALALLRRAEALRQRAALLRRGVPDDAAFDALREDMRAR